MLDAVGEMANVVGGNVKSLLPGPSTLALPIVVTSETGVGHAVAGRGRDPLAPTSPGAAKPSP